MPESNEIKKSQNKDFDYVFELEERLRDLQTERQITAARLTQLQLDLERTKRELMDLKTPPLIVGTITDVLDDKRAIVRNSNGMDFLVTALPQLEKELEAGKRVAMNQRTLVITEVFPENRDWRVNAMEIIEKPEITFNDIGGLDAIQQELNEAIILPLKSPEKFKKLGIEAPNGVLLFGLPGTGKTMLAKAVANATKSTFISLSGSDLVKKYIGEGSKLVKDLFRLAKEKKPSIIFIDEIDAVASHRFASINGDREVQRTMMQLLSEMDGFHKVEGVKIMAATNRIDMLDNALLRPGRFDKIIEVPLPDEKGRQKIFEIHTKKMTIDKNVNLKELAELTEGFTGAEIKGICTEAGLFAMRNNKEKITMKEFIEAINKLTKKSQKDLPHQRMFA
ncbi:MAG: proteasome-activating nucleotidase [Candidatus Diapherotrites archaeon]